MTIGAESGAATGPIPAEARSKEGLRLERPGASHQGKASSLPLKGVAINGDNVVADAAMDSAQCIGCCACVAACPNGAANLFTAAKIAHLNLLPQGQAERYKRTEAMVETMDEYFGSCTNHGECEAACPKEISIDVIALMNKDYRKSKLKNRKEISRS